MDKIHTILVIGFRDAQILDITGPVQMFQGANHELGRQAYRIQLAGPDRGAFRTTSGLQLTADLSVHDVTDVMLAETDTLLISGGEGSRADTSITRAIDQLVARANGRVRRIVSVCTGVFFLGRAGLLDGRRVTTHWALLDALGRLVPEAEVAGDAIYVEDGGLWTSAGVTAGIDLALALIEADHGRDVALAVARQHVVYRVRPGGQAQFSETAAASGLGHDRLDGLAAAVARDPRRDWRIEELADEIAVSVRTLTRLFQAYARTSPARFVERIRVDQARTALVETAATVESIAHQTGFGSLRRLERAFDRSLGISPSEFRARFRAPDPEPLLEGV